MTKSFRDALTDIVKTNNKVSVLNVDLSKALRLIKFQERFPNNMFGFGISETDMLVSSVGMATTGLIPVVVKNMGNMAAKWKAFDWNVYEINGHNFEELFCVIDSAKKSNDKLSMILCDTIKGKGVSFMENIIAFHGKIHSKEEFEKAILELS